MFTAIGNHEVMGMTILRGSLNEEFNRTLMVLLGGITREMYVPVDYGEDYTIIIIGDANGLEPIVPTIAPLLGENGKPLPYIASNEITVFSIFDTGTDKVSSYRFDTRQPCGAVVKFDEFQLSA